MPVRVNSSPARKSTRAQQPGPVSQGPGLPFGLPYPPPGAPQKPAGLSLCMIVKDEEKFLAQCLRSVTGVVDEINIVDTGSTDKTVEIAQSFGARVEHREWRNDFAWARNEALAMATKRWILVLDADEELNADSKALVISLKNVPAHLWGVWVRCLNLADDYKGTGASSHALARLFPNNPRIRYRSLIHEFVSLDNSELGLDCKQSPIAITHYGYLTNMIEARDKAKRNLALIQKATEDEPDDPFHWYNLGTTALVVGNRDLAISGLEKMLEIVGEKPRAFVTIGLSTLADAYGDRDPENSERVAREALRRSPHFCNGHFALGRALAAQERFDEAREAFQAAIDDAPYNHLQFVCDDEVSVWKAHSEIGHTYARQGTNLSALEWFEKGLANRPSAQPLRINRARMLEVLGRFQECEEAYCSLYQDFADESSIRDYVNFLLRRHNYRAALDALEEAALRVPPKAAISWLISASEICDKAGIDSAERYLERAVALAPGAAVLLDNLERRYLARNDKAALDRLHEHERDAPCVEPYDYARRASRLIAEGDPQKALDVARRGLDLRPELPRLLHALALAHAALGQKDEAFDALNRIKPGDDPETFARATYMRSLLLFERGRHAEALIAADTVLAAKPNDPDTMLHRARILQALGRNAEVETTLRSALPFGGQKVAVALAAFFMQIGEFEKARIAADEALATA